MDNLIFLRHIYDCIKNIELFTKNISKDDFIHSIEKQSAIIRQLEILGEAAKNLSSDFKRKYPDVEWKKAAGTRDIIIHAYFNVDLDIVWDIIKNNLPGLKKQIKEILEKESKNI